MKEPYNQYPQAEELTKVINLCWNAVGNSAAGPVRKAVFQEGLTQRILTLEEEEKLRAEGKGERIQVLNDSVCIGLVQVLIAQLCPKSPALIRNVDDKGY